MEGLFIVAGILVIGVFVLLAQMQAQRAERRRTEFSNLVAQHGMRYFPAGFSDVAPGGFWQQLLADWRSTDAGRFLCRFEGFEPFGTGNRPKAVNICYGIINLIEWTLFDYSYTVTRSNGKTTSTVTYSFGVVAARIDYRLPSLTLGRESFMTRLFGAKDMNFEVEEFNQRYHVQTDDPAHSSQVINPAMIEYLLSLPVLSWQLTGNQILIALNSEQEPSKLFQIREVIEGFLHRVPDFVRDDRKLVGVSLESPF